MHGSMSRTPYVSSEYDPNAYKIQAPQNYPQYQIPTQQPQPPLYPTQTGSTSVALFTIPSDGTNSLYVDGIPNDTTEREVSRIFFFYSRHFSSFSRFPVYPLNQKDHTNRSLILPMLC